jgi:hypothetical protein
MAEGVWYLEYSYFSGTRKEAETTKRVVLKATDKQSARIEGQKCWKSIQKKEPYLKIPRLFSGASIICRKDSNESVCFLLAFPETYHAQ